MNTLIKNKIPIQHQQGFIIRFLKRFLKTQLGKHLAFNLGLKGFDRVAFVHIRNGKIIQQAISYNARVNKGAALQASLMAGSALGGATTPAAMLYVALSTLTLTPAMADTTLSGETSVAGLSRALGTAQNYIAPASLDGAASFDIYKQFTLTGAATTILSTGLFDAVSGGNLFAEANFAVSAPMATGDIIQVTWTINL